MEQADLVRQLRLLGVRRGGVLLVHTSFRAVRPVAGGPEGLIAALRAALGSEGTLVMPSWSGDDDRPFDPQSSPSASDLGVTADLFWRLSGVMRSQHLFAFAAVGPRAADVLQDPLPLPPHIRASPAGRVYQLDGQVLLLGVGHDANTTVHLAEQLARVPYRVARHCTVRKNGRPVRLEYVENDHCCALFARMDDWLRKRDLQREGVVGHAVSRLVRSRDVVAVATERLARDPLIFLHPPASGCSQCDAAHASVAGASAAEP